MQVQFKYGDAAKVREYALAHPDCIFKVETYFDKSNGSLILALPSGLETEGYLDFYKYIEEQLSFDFKI